MRHLAFQSLPGKTAGLCKADRKKHCDNSGGRLGTKVVHEIMLTLLLASVLTLPFTVELVQSEALTVIIMADGTIAPSTAPLLRDGNRYAFTGNVFGEIVVEKSNVTVDGNGYTLQGSGSGSGIKLAGVNGVTVQNTNIQSFTSGLWFDGSSGNTIFSNTIANCSYDGIRLDGSSGNTISSNTIKDN
jgi:parallel beta-helix repeat protein